jgi:hypothetical protein
MALRPAPNRSGEAVDAGVAISDLLRDPNRRSLSDDDLACEVRHRWQSGIDASRDLRLRQWVRNVLMTYGEQDIHWSQRADRWLTVPMKRIRRYKTNLLPGRIAIMAARMTQTAPDWTALPIDDSIEAEEDAKYCTKLLRYAYRENRVDLVRYFNTIQMCLFGFGVAELLINDEADVELNYEMEQDDNGQPVYDEKTGTPVYKMGRDGKPKVQEAVMTEGIQARPVSPFCFILPPGMEWPVLRDAPYLIKASWQSEEYIRRRYDVPRDMPLHSDSYGNYEAMVSYLWQVLNPQTLPVNRFEAGRLLVLQYYERAKDLKGFYEGKVYTVCGEHLIGNERSLWDDGRYPFFMFPWLPVTDSGYAYPWLNPQVDPQSRLNQTTTHLMDHLGKVGSPNIIADRNDGFPEDPVFHYRVYHTSPALRRPEFMQAPPAPAGVYQMRDEAKRDMDDTSTMYPLSRGEAQPGIASGLQARLVQDADQTEMGPVARMHAEEFGRMGEALLELYRVHGGSDKTVVTLGENARAEFFQFKRGKIPVKARVIVQEDSLVVHYRSALEERAQQLAATGAFGNMLTDARARSVFLKAIRDPHLEGPLTPEEMQKQYLDELHYDIIHEGKEVDKVDPWWDLNAHREAAQYRLLRESRKWDKQTMERFMHYWGVLEQAQQQVADQAQQAQKQAMQDQVEAQGQVFEAEQKAKMKTEMLRGTTKLAVESMKDPNNQGAGVGGGASVLTSPTKMQDQQQPVEGGDSAGQ